MGQIVLKMGRNLQTGRLVPTHLLWFLLGSACEVSLTGVPACPQGCCPSQDDPPRHHPTCRRPRQPCDLPPGPTTARITTLEKCGVAGCNASQGRRRGGGEMNHKYHRLVRSTLSTLAIYPTNIFKGSPPCRTLHHLSLLLVSYYS